MSDIFTKEYISKKLAGFSPAELAMYFVEGTCDKSIHPSLEDAIRDREMIWNYLGQRPEDFQDDFKRELEKIVSPSVSLKPSINPFYMPVMLRAAFEDGGEEILEFPPVFFN